MEQPNNYSIQYDLELDKIIEIIQEKHYSRILIQVPEGMLDKPLKTILDTLSSLNISVFVSGDPCYGICDLASGLASSLKCDLLLHFGHTEFGFEQKIATIVDESLDVIIIPTNVKIDINPYLSKISNEIKRLKWKKIVLLATAQHLADLKEIKSYLDSSGIQSIIQGTGQILGCHTKNAFKIPQHVDGILSFHAGKFHTRGLLLNTSFPVLQFDLFSGNSTFHSKRERAVIIQKRHGLIHRAREAKYWGILGSSKIGQYHSNQISELEEILSGDNKSKMVIIAENLNSLILMNIQWVDAWVSTACPRLAIDDRIQYAKPILTYKEFLYLFNRISWEKILESGFF
ncbi:MAG: diphthamide biosynthesis enzyme Dph2 [Candidatus Hodarchaeales archaeon]